jgi:Nucleotidyltransferase of unknown function (DUF6036)
MLPRETIVAFDQYLLEQALSLRATIVGDAALSLLGFTDRQTRDVDVLHPDLPESITAASVSFARRQRSAGIHLADDWLNNGPSQLKDILPEGWNERLQAAFAGQALQLSVLGRADLLKTKLFALCDRGTDLRDCIALAPSSEELACAKEWVAYQDTNPGWPDHVHRTLEDLRRRLGHGVS